MRFWVNASADVITGQPIYETDGRTIKFCGGVRGVTSMLVFRDFNQMEVDENGRAL